MADNRRRGRLACKARSCSRRARFSRTSSSREPKGRMTQAMRCQSDENIAEILREPRQRDWLQINHFKSARPFDEEQLNVRLTRSLFCLSRRKGQRIRTRVQSYEMD